MKFKYYIRGAGIGILFSTIILFASFKTGGYEIKKDNKPTDVIETSTADVITDTEMITTEEITTEEVTTEEVTTEATTTEATTTEATTTEATTTEATTQATTKEESESNSSSSKIKITVSSGDWSDQVAYKCKKAGLVSDANDFDVYLCKHGYDVKLTTGTFTFDSNKKYSYEEIAKKLTTKK